jgi:hypothetical protein
MVEKNNMSINEMVDEIISKHEQKNLDNTESESKKEPMDAQMPFRYITGEEITKELNIDEEEFHSKKLPDNLDAASQFWEKHYVMGDSKKIESVLKKHETNRKDKIV